jgi:T5SS/PEP-CTERM-associated repeat protein
MTLERRGLNGGNFSRVALLATLLIVGAPGSARGLVIDVGDVVVSGGNLLIGTTADGQRTVSGEANGPFGTVNLGNGGGFTGTLIVTGAAGSVTTGNTNIGNGSTGVLLISEGAQYNHTNQSGTFIGSNNPASIGTVTVTGVNSQLNAARAVQVGLGSDTGGGVATLNVLAGGLVNAPRMPVGAATGDTPGGVGTVNVAGAGSLIHRNLASSRKAVRG